MTSAHQENHIEPAPWHDGAQLVPLRGQPVVEKKARWRVLYDRMATLQIGELLSYEDMGELLGLDFLDRPQRNIINVSARKAATELEKKQGMVFRIMRGHGYQRAKPEQVLDLARRHQHRAQREVASGAAKVATIDLRQLDSTTARIVEATAMAFARQEAIMRSLDVRQDRLDVAMQALGVRQQVTDQRVTQTAQRVDATLSHIERLEQEVLALKAQHNAGNAPTAAPVDPAQPEFPTLSAYIGGGL